MHSLMLWLLPAYDENNFPIPPSQYELKLKRVLVAVHMAIWHHCIKKSKGDISMPSYENLYSCLCPQPCQAVLSNVVASMLGIPQNKGKTR